MIPSTTPSSPSHCFKISSWIKDVQVDVEIKFGEPIAPVMGKKLALQETRLSKSRAGAPATMPSKSPGNISAAFMPWRPPSEQPR